MIGRRLSILARMDLLTLDLPGIRKVASGKVREIFDLGEHLLLVAGDDRQGRCGGLIDLADIGRIAAHFSRELSSGLLQAKFRFFEGSSRKHLIRAIYRNAAHFVADRDPLMRILWRLIAPHPPFVSDEAVRVRGLVAGKGH